MGSEMCIRDSLSHVPDAALDAAFDAGRAEFWRGRPKGELYWARRPAATIEALIASEVAALWGFVDAVGALCAAPQHDDDAVWFGSRACRLVRTRGGACERDDHAALRDDASEAALRVTLSRAAPLAAPDGGAIPVVVPAMPCLELRAPTDAERTPDATARTPTAPPALSLIHI